MQPLHRPEPGTRLVFRWRKWDGSPHWEHDCVYLGHDEWGEWFGQRPGWSSARPGRATTAQSSNVSLVPPSGDYCYTHNLPPQTTRIYIDIAWDVGWDAAGLPVGIDMDLDVVRRDTAAPYEREGVLRRPGEVYVEDRDEWDEHRVQFGYPLDIVTRLEDVAVELERRVRAEETPFDEATAQRWFTRFDELA